MEIRRRTVSNERSLELCAVVDDDGFWEVEKEMRETHARRGTLVKRSRLGLAFPKTDNRQVVPEQFEYHHHLIHSFVAFDPPRSFLSFATMVSSAVNFAYEFIANQRVTAR